MVDFRVRVPRQLTLAWDEFRLNRVPFVFRWMTYRVNERKELFMYDSSEPDDEFEDFLDALPKAKCCTAIYNMVRANSEGVELERFIIFVSWSPPLADATDKTQHAEAKLLLHSALQGVSVHMHANDREELSLKIFRDLALAAPSPGKVE